MSSKRSKVFQISSWVEYFDDVDLTAVEKRIQEKLENVKSRSKQAQLLLFVTAKYMEHSDIDDIYKQASSIWDKKYKIKKIKLFQSNNKLCELPRDPIVNISKYLTKEESIILGQTNRHLYIVSQQQAYISNRPNDKPFNLTIEKIYDMIAKRDSSIANYDINTFTYSMPSNIYLSEKFGCLRNYFFDQKLKMENPYAYQWFESLFRNVTNIRCNNNDDHGILSYIPIHFLFNNKLKTDLNQIEIDADYYEKCNCSHDPYLSSFSIEYITSNGNQIEKFFTNYQRYFNTHCESRINKIRRLNKIKVIAPNHGTSTLTRSILGKCLSQLSPNYKELILGDGPILISNLSTICKIFHPNLTSLRLFSPYNQCNPSESNGYHSIPVFEWDPDMMKMENGIDEKDIGCEKKYNSRKLELLTADKIRQIGSNVKEFEIQVHDFDEWSQRMAAFNQLGKFHLLSKVEKIILDWDIDGMGNRTDYDYNFRFARDIMYAQVEPHLCNQVFNHFWGDYNDRALYDLIQCQYPRLNTLSFRLDHVDIKKGYVKNILHRLEKILHCLIISRDKIVNNSNIKYIEFGWHFSLVFNYWRLDLVLQEFSLDEYHSLFDTFEVTQAFDHNNVEMIQVTGDLSNDSIGEFYQNMVYWLKTWIQKENNKGFQRQDASIQQVFRYCINIEPNKGHVNTIEPIV